jgi:hypothetical protein
MEFSEQDLRTVLNRALRNILIAAGIGIPILWVGWGWRSMLLFLVGGVIAATGILEWRELMTAVLARFNTAGEIGDAPRPMGPILFWFFVRLVAAGGLLYVSLKTLNGKAMAVLLGIALALISLFIEALRLLRGWSA